MPTRVTLLSRCYTTCRRAAEQQQANLVMACLSKLNTHFNNRPYRTQRAVAQLQLQLSLITRCHAESKLRERRYGEIMTAQ